MTEVQKSRFAERERQIELAKQRGDIHIGGEVKDIIEQRRVEKKKSKVVEK